MYNQDYIIGDRHLSQNIHRKFTMPWPHEEITMKEQIREVVIEMTNAAGLDKSFADEFYKNIIDDEPVLNEFLTYLKTGKFISAEKVRGYSVVDILVFQMDHFKAFLDRDTFGTQNNECQMILLASDTFMKMKIDPEKYVRLMSEESGSDYDGKF